MDIHRSAGGARCTNGLKSLDDPWLVAFESRDNYKEITVLIHVQNSTAIYVIKGQILYGPG